MKFLATVIDADFTVSFISYIEFLGYKDVSSVAINFIALADVLEINGEIINICIELRKTTSMKLPDTIIAATALFYGLILITRNMSDFKNIKGLQLIELYSFAN